MTITICGSMALAEQMIDYQQKLEALGHRVFVSEFIESYLGRSDEDKLALTLHHKYQNDAIKEHWEKIKASDAILVMNLDRKGIAHYIGGNTLMEIGFAHVLDKKIYLLNPIPNIELYKTEIEATKPIVLHGNLNNMQFDSDSEFVEGID
ncbi:hypothetical protein HZA86_04735 [Candidatus Uhrbacteria bacterium]|nr:hypothetical protein [Candidatus Uhrbacteria bacterium]